MPPEDYKLTVLADEDKSIDYASDELAEPRLPGLPADAITD